ncbi:helix-turn-helix transcriptional regulator [Methanolobus chelungpuianus]|uniref:Transcriptional regulator n=1 Tax=Methanolobus chelungpuianus TaxID=502115 RepID=A0AAE3HBG0_9EURY|nr:winged helix-turn-helix domain-containing protein [Methanolobus chelungpuianus]MCQ6963525.1 transcriptional regulator [Methanolobus chelungpuianus]
MRKMLVDVIFASEKRKDMLLLLREGKMEMGDILSSLDTTRQALLPQAKVLEEHHLVTHRNDSYELTAIGELLVAEIIPLIDKAEVMGVNLDYWGTHDLGFIPPHLLDRIGDIRECTVTEPSLVDTYEVNRDFLEMAYRSSSLYFIFNFMHPSLPSIIDQFLQRNIDVYIIVSKDVLKKLKEELHEVTERFITGGKMRCCLHEKEMKLLSLAINDSCFVLRLFSRDNTFCNKQLACCTPRAHQWARDLFDHYMKDSVPITKL